MERYNERMYFPYSWHQSHDQATVLVMVPHDTQDEDLSVRIESEYLVVGVKGQTPTIKGRLYSTVDTSSSVWQLEHRASRGLSQRERTTSTTSTASTQSSYALVSSDPDISSSFAASLASGQVSESEDAYSPAPSSPLLIPVDGSQLPPRRRLPSNIASSRSVSPGRRTGGPQNLGLPSMPSSFSSLESLHSPQSGRLLTIHLEKQKPIIWPSLVVGPAPEDMSPISANSVVFNASDELEHRYNMDPTSLALIALELADIRKEKENAFEYFLRAWHQAHVPSATMRLVSLYVPLNLTSNLSDSEWSEEDPTRGTLSYYLRCIGGRRGVAQLYLEAGLLHLDGAATTLLSASYSSLSSIRMTLQSQVGEGGTEAWKRDREAAAKYFERARVLQPDLDIPSLPVEGALPELEIPSLDLAATSTPESYHSGPESLSGGTDCEVPTIRRRRDKKAEMELVNTSKSDMDDMDDQWFYYVPNLVGAGTALLVLGVVGVLSLSNWSRRNQSS